MIGIADKNINMQTNIGYASLDLKSVISNNN